MKPLIIITIILAVAFGFVLYQGMSLEEELSWTKESASYWRDEAGKMRHKEVEQYYEKYPEKLLRVFSEVCKGKEGKLNIDKESLEISGESYYDISCTRRYTEQNKEITETIFNYTIH